MSCVMPERKPYDGAVGVRLYDSTNGRVFTLRVEHNGRGQVMHIGEHNAARLIGMLACMIGMDLGRKLSKAIKF